MEELSTLSFSLCIAAVSIYFLFFYSNDDDDQDGGKLIKASQKI
tara:strand:+ start:210 stop:341 length:132 start_codon:yes stop_codon:yes gene_type:complete